MIRCKVGKREHTAELMVTDTPLHYRETVWHPLCQRHMEALQKLSKRKLRYYPISKEQHDSNP